MVPQRLDSDYFVRFAGAFFAFAAPGSFTRNHGRIGALLQIAPHPVHLTCPVKLRS